MVVGSCFADYCLLFVVCWSLVACFVFFSSPRLFGVCVVFLVVVCGVLFGICG